MGNITKHLETLNDSLRAITLESEDYANYRRSVHILMGRLRDMGIDSIECGYGRSVKPLEDCAFQVLVDKYLHESKKDAIKKYHEQWDNKAGGARLFIRSNPS